MAHKNKVLRSINNEDASRCVDIFVRPDTVGFEEYRRDLEDNRGWFPIGSYDTRVFDNEGAALEAARAEVVWLRQIVNKWRKVRSGDLSAEVTSSRRRD